MNFKDQDLTDDFKDFLKEELCRLIDSYDPNAPKIVGAVPVATWTFEELGIRTREDYEIFMQNIGFKDEKE